MNRIHVNLLSSIVKSCVVAGFIGQPCFGFEKASVLPKGVRALRYKAATTSFNSKTNATGTTEVMGKPIEKELTFNRVLAEREPIERSQLKAFLEVNGFDLKDSVGTFQADVAGNVNVNALALAYGITETLTLAVGAPYYQARVKTELGFVPKIGMINKVMLALDNPVQNQTAKAQELVDKVNSGPEMLTEKLQKNGFQDIREWSGSGIGDTVMAVKQSLYDGSILKVTHQSGIIAPTGAVKNADALTSIPFGKGAWQAFFAVVSDQVLFEGVFFNETLKYSYVAPQTQHLRLATEDEAVAVPKDMIRYKLGDQLDLDTSLQFESKQGPLGGIGLTYMTKAKDNYSSVQNISYLSPDARNDVESKLSSDTDQKNMYGSLVVGYSTVPLFKRKEAKVPMLVSLEYKKHLLSKNTVVQNLVSFDLGLFF